VRQVKCSAKLLSMARRFEMPNGIIVDYRSPEEWAIVDTGACWSEENQEWIPEPIPSNRSEDFLNKTRYPLDEAIRIAQTLEVS